MVEIVRPTRDGVSVDRGDDPLRAGQSSGVRTLRVAMVGTRGVPAHYGGFETAVEEVGARLAARGHEVTVYCRSSRNSSPLPTEYKGMGLIHLPAARRRSLETLSHTALSVAHLTWHGSYDAVLMFNAANSPFLPVLWLRGGRSATHVDGLEWRRGKWGRAGRAYYRKAESLAVRWSDALIADAQGIADYYATEFGARTETIAYGAPILGDVGSSRLEEVNCAPRQYHLVVARFEPENHVDLAIEGYLHSGSTLPLVVVGSNPYGGLYSQRIHALAGTTEGVRLLGGIWDQELLDQLYANCLSYIHGHSVGGTNPSLLRAMGAAAAVIAYDVNFNREVLGVDGALFKTPSSLAERIIAAEADVKKTVARGQRLAERAQEAYDWDNVADQYERLCAALALGSSQRGIYSGRRRRGAVWQAVE